MSQKSEEFIQLIQDVLQSDRADGVKFQTIKDAALEVLSACDAAVNELDRLGKETSNENVDLRKAIKEKDYLVDQLRETRDQLGVKVEQSRKTLRDEYAMASITGIMGHSMMTPELWEAHERLVQKSFQLADEALKQRAVP